MIYVVEECQAVDGDTYDIVASYCFDTEREAVAFHGVMVRTNKPEHYIIHKRLFTHMQDA